MHHTVLGNTGLSVSVAGLGCGGNSRLGLGVGKSDRDAIALVRAAKARGVTFFDTAESYGTEHILGAAFSPSERQQIVISTKSRVMRGEERLTPGAVVANLETSLRRLNTDHVDVFLFHGVAPQHYGWVREELGPSLLAEQAKGKIGHLGLSETSPNDPHHAMLQQALQDPIWEVAMFAFHMLNQGARQKVFPRTMSSGVGTLLMFVVRNLFSRPSLLVETIRNLAKAGKLPEELARAQNPLDFLLHPHGAASLTDAAYRYARHEPGANVVLFGTSEIAHLEANIASILAPPLPESDTIELRRLFQHLTGVGLDLPDRVKP